MKVIFFFEDLPNLEMDISSNQKLRGLKRDGKRPYKAKVPKNIPNKFLMTILQSLKPNYTPDKETRLKNLLLGNKFQNIEFV